MYFRNNNFGLPPMVNRRKPTQNRDRSPNTTRQYYPVNYKSNENHQRNLSPNKLNATKKPFSNLMSPKNIGIHKNFSNPKIQNISQPTPLNLGSCLKHHQKHAQFLANVNGQTLPFCERCAIQLASQGAEILKIHDHKKPSTRSRSRQSFKRLKYQGRPQYQQLKLFMDGLNTAEEKHANLISKLANIDQHYTTQINLTQRFYTELIETIKQMRQDHVNDLIKEGQKHSQVGDIEKANLQENIQEMKLFRNDIESQIDVIIEDFKDNQNKFVQIMNFYRNKVGMFQIKSDEVEEFLSGLINYKNKDFNKQMNDIEEFILETWQTQTNPIKPQHNHVVNKGVKIGNIIQFEQTRHENNGKSFCRQLFPEHEVQGQAEISPQFKNI